MHYLEPMCIIKVPHNNQQIRAYIKNPSEILGANYILNVKGVGYRFNK